VLKLRDEEGRVSSVKVSLKYIPVKMDLDPSESINNMGNLRVDVLDAQDLLAMDSNGKSDPYVKFELNGEEIFKSKTQKKTLNPVWNEFFEVSVPSRTAAAFKAAVWDWDFADKPDPLGETMVRLDQLEPFKAQEMRLPLVGSKGKHEGKPAGQLRIRLLFRPDYIVRTRQGTSTFGGTFSAPGRIITGVAGAPIKGVGVVGHGVGKGASFLKRGFTGRKDKDKDLSNGGSQAMESLTEVPSITTSSPDAGPGRGLRRSNGIGSPEADEPSDLSPPGPALGGHISHARTKSVGASSIHSAMLPGASSGTASFTVLSASGFPPSSDLYVSITQIRDSKSKTVGKTKHHKASGDPVKFEETFKISCTPDSLFKVGVKNNHTFGHDDDLGEAVFPVDESNSGEEKEVRVGSGSVLIRSSFTPAESSHLSALVDSPKGMRRSFMGRRDAGRAPPSRDGTPSA
jgi:Ca2+-dependent lipid-binding protein